LCFVHINSSLHELQVRPYSEGCRHSGLLGFWTSSIVWYYKKHNVHEAYTVVGHRRRCGRHLVWVLQKALTYISQSMLV
jgi:hypothetical protein